MFSVKSCVPRISFKYEENCCELIKKFENSSWQSDAVFDNTIRQIMSPGYTWIPFAIA
jgi:hypothetical protein